MLLCAQQGIGQGSLPIPDATSRIASYLVQAMTWQAGRTVVQHSAQFNAQQQPNDTGLQELLPSAVNATMIRKHKEWDEH